MPRHLMPALALAFVAASAIAVPSRTVMAQSSEELRLPERMDRALRDMMQDMKPTLDELLDSLEPALEGMHDYMRSFGGIDDPRHYEMPEVLPNGDIIIRRSQDAPPFIPPEPDEPPERDDMDPPPVGPDPGIRT